MVQVQAEIKRGFLRQLAEGAKKTSSTLREALLAGQAAVFTANFQKGRLLVSTSGSGQSGSFEIGVAGKDFTQANVFALFEELIGILEDCVGQGLAADSGVPADTDTLLQVLFDDDRLRGITSQCGDFTGLNIPSVGGIPSQ